MKKILFDLSNFDITTTSGGSAAAKAYLKAVIECNLGNIDVLKNELDPEFNIPDISIINAPIRSKLKAIINLYNGYCHCGAPVIKNFCKLKTYDIYFLNSGLNSGCIIEDIRKSGAKSVLLHHNYEPEYSMDSKTLFTLKGRTDRFIKYWEGKAYRNADINLFLTVQDKILFETNYGKRDNNYVLGMFEASNSKKLAIREPQKKTIAISCSLCSLQNIYALKRFEPILRDFCKRYPDWKILLMGRNPSPEILSMQDVYDNIKVYSNPDDIQALCASCAIYLCPMDLGGGLKLRIMDGLRNGMPIITHSVSSRGYDSFFTKDYFCIYDDESSFFNQFEKMQEKVDDMNSNREKIQNDYYNYFGFQAGVNRLSDSLKSIDYKI